MPLVNNRVLRNIDVDETADVGVARPVRITSLVAFNNAAAVIYLKLYNTAVAATVGTTTPVMTIPLAVKVPVTVSWDKGVLFDTGLSPAATTGVGDSDTGAVGTNDCIINVIYDS